MTADAVYTAVREERDVLREKVALARRLHDPDRSGWCDRCDDPSPCAEARILDGDA